MKKSICTPLLLALALGSTALLQAQPSNNPNDTRRPPTPSGQGQSGSGSGSGTQSTAKVNAKPDRPAKPGETQAQYDARIKTEDAAKKK